MIIIAEWKNAPSAVFDWPNAIALRTAHLAGFGNLPPPLAQHPALEAIAIVSLVADLGIAHDLIPDSTLPRLTIAGRQSQNYHPLVDQLLNNLALAIAAHTRGNFSFSFSISQWLTDHDLEEFVIAAIVLRGDGGAHREILAHAAHQTNALMQQQRHLQRRHMHLLLERDAPELVEHWQHCAPDTVAWLLARKHDGDPSRALRVERRRQALRLYSSLAHRLQEPAITAIIDDGRELVPALAHRLLLSRTQLAALREAGTPMPPPGAQLTRPYEHAVRHLQAHNVPLHQWPGGGSPGQRHAWHASRWLRARGLSPIRADYYEPDSTTILDAVRAFNDDLLAPLLADQTKPGDDCRRPDDLFAALGRLLDADTLSADQLTRIQHFIAAIRSALVGDRGPKSFHAATLLWHRRAAAVAALRNENQTDQPGWPALCPPWTSRSGRFQIVPLTTAKDLVIEGNTHHHCVGTYYDACRSGHTQILSLRENGTPIVTAEILLNNTISAIRVGQFKGHRNTVPDNPEIHQAMRDFLHELRSGAHSLNRQQLRAYRASADERLYALRRQSVSLDHARQAFALYRVLLPRHAPGDFDAWCAANNLRAVLRRALDLVVDQDNSIAF